MKFEGNEEDQKMVLLEYFDGIESSDGEEEEGSKPAKGKRGAKSQSMLLSFCHNYLFQSTDSGGLKPLRTGQKRVLGKRVVLQVRCR